MSRRAGEALRRINRFADGPITKKKLFLAILVITFFFLYLGPSVLHWLFGIDDQNSGHLNVCQTKYLDPFLADSLQYDAYIRQENSASLPSLNHNYVPYVGVDSKEYEVVTGMIPIPDSENVLAAAVVCRKLSNTIQIDPKEGLDILVLTTVQYSDPIKQSEYAKQKDIVEKKALAEMEKAIGLTTDRTALKQFKNNHARVWQGLWFTGFYISDSKAEGIVNGDRINATTYAILSQVRSYEHEENIKKATKTEILRSLTYSEGCYGGHSTLDADNLWKPLNTLNNLNGVASVWLLTLEKQGCHNLLKAGASGVNQALILSFGSLRFSNQHLEYKIHPSELHRDFLFRRVNYGNMTHVNISVILQEDNKAAIFVALDRSDKNYYACDAGCLDSPVQLGPYRKYFPVKLTKPLTPILYITADKQHMEDLRHTIHVSEVVEAPAHETHVIALHKHGHNLGGLSPLFWISIVVKQTCTVQLSHRTVWYFFVMAVVSGFACVITRCYDNFSTTRHISWHTRVLEELHGRVNIIHKTTIGYALRPNRCSNNRTGAIFSHRLQGGSGSSSEGGQFKLCRRIYNSIFT
ncbi:Uncharacterized protein KIAA2013 homolog [Eumeta japonica]|uniref:Uncharacterized protein KIAA2013 homolog n=1 Tax=Eumeta variegata TaxID=151549 RepID=A0A4C1VLD3_EUMVA|nr:Uncharacterized protein KIAA2013 homolog [Eumeta japonica]